MPKKSLLETNPYLRNPAKRKEMIARTVITSTAIEGVRISPELFKKQVKKPA